MRCLRIKTCSGVGFVVGLSAAIFFLCVIAVSVPAAGWKTEILFPVIFLLVLVEVKLVPTEKLPYIHNKEKIDRFFENKLGAIAEG